MPEGQGNTEKFTPAQIIAALRAAGGIKLGAALKLKCSPQTIHNYIARYPEIAAEIPKIKEDTLDLAETKLIEKVGKGDMQAIKFYLETQGRERGYVRKNEVGGPGGAPLLPAGGVVTVFQLPDNQRQPPPADAPAPDGGAS